MMTPKKKPEVVTPEQEFVTVNYKPCDFCGSELYDRANGEVTEGNIFRPNNCDQCAYGDLKKSGISIH